MPFDFVHIVEKLEKSAPEFSKKISIKFLGLVSPFNAHLKLKMLQWTRFKVQVEMSCHRAVKNHIGGIHAGALFTVGETCAGLLLVRNFKFADYRPIMAKISVEFLRQARSKVIATSEINEILLREIQLGLNRGESQTVDMQTHIIDEEGQVVSRVMTQWQIKAWDQVRLK